MRNTSLAILLALVGASAAANEATIYRDRGFSGPAMAARDAKPDLRLAWPVNSVRIVSGTWELCPERGYRGRCITVNRSSPNLAASHGWSGQVGSMRPLGGSGWGGSGGSGGSGWGGSGGSGGSGWGGSGGSGGGLMPSDNRSLRGSASEYFPSPANRGYRVEACPGSSVTFQCAQRNADNFCRGSGWNRAAHQRPETIRGRVYLADVLCVSG
ncbi:beta/gamma crystallin-related protein [Thermaurantiacus sp.]